MEAKQLSRQHIIKTAYMPLGKASVQVEYELVDGEAQVLNAFVNGMWSDPQDWLSPVLFDNWQSELTRGHREDEARTHEDGKAMLQRVMAGQGLYLLPAAQAEAVDETAEWAREQRA